MRTTTTLQTGAGQLLSTLKYYLMPAGWQSIAQPATNKECLYSAGESTEDLIYIYLDNSAADRLAIQAGTGWNSNNNTLNNPTTTRYILLSTTYSMPLWLYYDKDRFIITLKNYSTYPYACIYAGLLQRTNTNNKSCVLVSGPTTYNGAPIGVAHTSAWTTALGNLVVDHGGVHNRTMYATALNTLLGNTQCPNPVDGKLLISPILIGEKNIDIQGSMKGLYSAAGCDIANEDTIQIDNTIFDCFIINSYKIAIEQ